MISLRAIFFRRDALLLHCICTTLKPDSTVNRLISHGYFTSLQGNRLLFFDYASRKIGRHSFINRARYISELKPFEWDPPQLYGFQMQNKSNVTIIIILIILITLFSTFIFGSYYLVTQLMFLNAISLYCECLVQEIDLLI